MPSRPQKSRPAPRSAASHDGRAAILRNRAAIIDALIKRAKTGSYLHARFLFDYAGIFEPKAPDGEEDVSLARQLLEELHLEQEAAQLERDFLSGHGDDSGNLPRAQETK